MHFFGRECGHNLPLLCSNVYYGHTDMFLPSKLAMGWMKHLASGVSPIKEGWHPLMTSKDVYFRPACLSMHFLKAEASTAVSGGTELIQGLWTGFEHTILHKTVKMCIFHVWMRIISTSFKQFEPKSNSNIWMGQQKQKPSGQMFFQTSNFQFWWTCATVASISFSSDLVFCCS